jgi:hypothetical protein
VGKMTIDFGERNSDVSFIGPFSYSFSPPSFLRRCRALNIAKSRNRTGYPSEGHSHRCKSVGIEGLCLRARVSNFRLQA